MLEIPEAAVFSMQMTSALTGRTICEAKVAASPHKFAWFNMKAGEMESSLVGRRILGAAPAGGMVSLRLDGGELVLCDGVSSRFHAAGEPFSEKHQLMLRLDDSTSLACSVQMYGGLYLLLEGEAGSMYYSMALSKPSPLSVDFSEGYFLGVMKPLPASMGLKAALATEQRIPGLGNGVLQDILLDAGLNPKDKVGSLKEEDLSALYRSITGVLAAMRDAGGRDSERDLFGNPGGYRVMAGRNTAGCACPKCGIGTIQKGSHMGGSIYYCSRCQAPK